MEIRRLAAMGHAVTVIGEGAFWKLVESKAPSRKNAKKGKKKSSRTQTRRTSAR